MGEAERRRRRLRHHGDTGTPADAESAGADGSTASTTPVHDDVAPRSARGGRPGEPEPRGRRGSAPAEEGERGLRGLVGSGSSQVSVTAALRARDAARPTEDDLAEAEQRVVLIRRNWVPREELPRNGR
ncbi:hypothetical protein O7607_18770 [Micromonospora sp. WMMA1949]|uniref:hypothetical protein n=1 Tax=unclassified Micromonospora TaxID=2617518 RepID=UPI0022B61445|nr:MULTISPECIES: hypothetical protein [unclassified Micromonospora]MCZ7427785.1 hypothetical protein [Micromonospora sp. WMMA1949]WBC06703.1 hypothetical protein O7604_15710 [Micromonospora sp. WMMA1947]